MNIIVKLNKKHVNIEGVECPTGEAFEEKGSLYCFDCFAHLGLGYSKVSWDVPTEGTDLTPKEVEIARSQDEADSYHKGNGYHRKVKTHRHSYRGNNNLAYMDDAD